MTKKSSTEENPAAGATSGRTLQKFQHAGVTFYADELFTGSQEDVAAHHAAGNIDAHPDAVAYVKATAKTKKATVVEG